jgi:hypothetical protein
MTDQREVFAAQPSRRQRFALVAAKNLPAGRRRYENQPATHANGSAEILAFTVVSSHAQMKTNRAASRLMRGSNWSCVALTELRFIF